MINMKKTYSHYGCRSCKRKRVKCDEARPACSNCLTKNISCEYSYEVFIFQPEKHTKKVSRKNFKKINVENKESKPLIDFSLSNAVINESIQEFHKALHEEDLNEDEKSRSIKENIRFQDHTYDPNGEFSFDPPSYIQYWKVFDRNRYRYLYDKLDARGIGEFSGQYSEYDPEVQEFIWLQFTTSKCMSNYILVIDDSKNCVTKWFEYFGRKYSIIGHVLNTVTANFLSVRCNDTRWELIRKRSMERTLKSLALGVNECDSFSEMTSYLICIMFLYSERSATKTTAWRLHLRGALAILEKCDSLYSEIIQFSYLPNEELKYATQMFSFAKNWFVTAETMACLSAPNGGAINSISKANKILSYTSDRIDDGFYFHGFNLVKCYSQNLTPVFVKLIGISMDLRSSREIILSSASGILQNNSLDNEYESLAYNLLSIIESVESEKFDFFDIKDYKARACMRACNLCHCLSLKIFINSVFLDKPIYGKDIQICVQLIAENLLSISDIEQFGLCVHWPVFIAALCAPDSERVIFLDFLKTVCSRGKFVVRNTVERLERAWASIDNGEILDEEGYDCIVL